MKKLALAGALARAAGFAVVMPPVPSTFGGYG